MNIKANVYIRWSAAISCTFGILLVVVLWLLPKISPDLVIRYYPSMFVTANIEAIYNCNDYSLFEVFIEKLGPYENEIFLNMVKQFKDRGCDSNSFVYTLIRCQMYPMVELSDEDNDWAFNEIESWQ